MPPVDAGALTFDLDNVVMLVTFISAGIVWGMKLERRIDKLDRRITKTETTNCKRTKDED